MTGARVKVGFALGAALAGMLAAAVRLTGLDDGATATADEAARPAASSVAGAAASPRADAGAAGTAGASPAPIPATAAERWRAKPPGPGAVTARVVNRAAARKGAEAAPDAAACTAGPAPARGAGDPEPPGPAAACTPEPRTEPVEIDWNAPKQAR